MLEQQIHMLRKERGWSQTELAKRMQISEKAIKNWERGISKPSASNIVTLAKIFCVSTDYLFGLERRNPLYIDHLHIDHLPESEQLRVRFLVQAYTDMVQKELQKGTLHF